MLIWVHTECSSAVCHRSPCHEEQDTMTYTYYQKYVKPQPQTDGKKGWVSKSAFYEGDELPEDIICPF